ncbi:PAS domain S-box protein [Desulfobulbus sp.]|uniref:PAS domain S-box protein n=1 Tax=Desulfobulbus sp. TaxID=895 RepID=UPI0027B99CCC|nr:PAS domain S-box protein [Desulfobulbus sp.]
MQDTSPSPTNPELNLQFVLDASPVAMLVFNHREEIILTNAPAHRLFDLAANTGRPRKCGDCFRCANRLKEALGRGHSPLCPVCPLLKDLRTTLAATATESLEGEAQFAREPDGSPFWIRYKITPLSISDKPAALLTLDDITALRHSERQYAVLFHEMLNAFALHEILCNDQGQPVDYRFLEVNPAFARMTGLKADQVVGRTVRSVIPDLDEHWIRTYGQVALTGQPVRFESYSPEVGKHFLINAFSPTPGQFATLFEDISDLRLAEASLQENEARLRGVTNSAKDAIVMMDPAGRISFWNPAAEALFGYTEEEAMGADLHRLLAPPRFLHIYQQAFSAFQRTGQGKAIDAIIELAACHKQGHEIPIELSLSAHHQTDGWHPIGILRDISERKQAEQLVRRNEERLRKLVEILQHPTDTSQEFLDYALEQAIQLTGSTIGYIYYYDEQREQFSLNSWSKEVMPACAVVNPKTCYALARTGIWGEAVRQRRPIVVNDFQAADPLKRGYPEGHVPLRRYMTAPIFSEERIVCVIGLANKETEYDQTDVLQTSLLMETVWNIAERKRVEEEQRRLQTQLNHAQKMEAIGALAGGIAHDFNNILSAVLGYAEMARDDSPRNSMAAKGMERVLEAGGRAAALVKQILAFSREGKSERIPVDPGSILKEVSTLLRPSLPSTITIQQKTAATRAILADPTQMHQILMNLCTNAFHAMEQTGGALEIAIEQVTLSAADLSRQPSIAPGDFVMLSVSDTGPGIAPEIRDRIFEPYFTTKGVGQGTGLGLSIVHGIVTEYGGFITCESDAGKGSIFRVFIPTINDLASLEHQPAEPVPSGREHILLVDDEQLLAEMGQSMLERLGYEVTVHASSADALADFQRYPNRFDALITDQTMPGMTGLALARRILHLRPDLPIILCTGYSRLVDEDQVRSCGIRGFVMKPFSIKEVAALLRTVLDTSDDAA